MKNRSVSEKSGRTIASAVTIGAAIAIGVSILLSMLLALLIFNESTNDNTTVLPILMITASSAFTGCLVSCRYHKTKCMLISGLTGGVYAAILIGAGILFFDGGLHKIWTSILSILIGYLGAYMICMNNREGRHRRKRLHR